MIPIVVIVHPIDTAAHPSVPPGWRWAVYMGAGNYSDLERCLNAGWQTSPTSAAVDGEACAATAVRALRLAGLPANLESLRLGFDPIPADAQRVHTV